MDAAVNLGHNSHFAFYVIHQQVLNWHGIMEKSTVLGGLMILLAVLLNEKFILIFQHKLNQGRTPLCNLCQDSVQYKCLLPLT